MPEIDFGVDRRYASLGEAAQFIHVNPRTIRDWIRAGRLTGYRFGVNTLRVDLNELERLGGALT